MDSFDMEKAPRPENVLREITKGYTRRIITRAWRIAGLLLLVIFVMGGVFSLAQIDIDVEQILNAVEGLKDERPVLAGLTTIASFWLGMSVLISISMLTVAFAALHGPWWGIFYATAGALSGGAFYYALGLLLHNSGWLDRFSVIRRVKEQFEKIRPYGTWAVAISRIIPSAPFLVVNLVTGMLGFRPMQFLAGSLIGLLPVIIAFSIFGDIIRRVFTDPGPANIAWFILLLAVYILLIRGIILLVKRVSGRNDRESGE
jgi:phospholipase D1/2